MSTAKRTRFIATSGVPGNVATSREIGDGLDAAWVAVCAAHRSTLAWIAEGERHGVWESDGCIDMAQWVAGQLGITNWVASRWVEAAVAIERLPLISEALETGALSIEKVVELTRFATPEDEKKLIAWARRVNPSTIRNKADVANRPSIEDQKDAHNARSIEFWPDDLMMRFCGAVPLDDGVQLMQALDGRAAGLPKAPDGAEDEVNCSLEARRADALMDLVLGQPAEGHGGDRATLVVHVNGEDILGEGCCGAEVVGGGVVHPEIARRLGCDGVVEWVLADADGKCLGIGFDSRRVPRWLRRQLEYRDRECTFPGCGSRRDLVAHHIVPWPKGPTQLDNLTLLCRFHHKLVHEHGWCVELDEAGPPRWSRPDGRPYDPGGRPRLPTGGLPLLPFRS